MRFGLDTLLKEPTGGRVKCVVRIVRPPRGAAATFFNGPFKGWMSAGVVVVPMLLVAMALVGDRAVEASADGSVPAVGSSQVVELRAKLVDLARSLPAGDAGPVVRGDRVSVLVHMAKVGMRTDAATAAAQRADVRRFADARQGVVRYEYDILPNVLNLRDIPAAAIDALRQLPGVVKVEEDRIIHTTLNTSIPLINGLQSQISDAGFTADGGGVRVCIVDTGIFHDHIMFAPGQIDTAAGWDFFLLTMATRKTTTSTAPTWRALRLGQSWG